MLSSGAAGNLTISGPEFRAVCHRIGDFGDDRGPAALHRSSNGRPLMKLTTAIEFLIAAVDRASEYVRRQQQPSGVSPMMEIHRWKEILQQRQLEVLGTGDERSLTPTECRVLKEAVARIDASILRGQLPTALMRDVQAAIDIDPTK